MGRWDLRWLGGRPVPVRRLASRGAQARVLVVHSAGGAARPTPACRVATTLRLEATSPAPACSGKRRRRPARTLDPAGQGLRRRHLGDLRAAEDATRAAPGGVLRATRTYRSRRPLGKGLVGAGEAGGPRMSTGPGSSHYPRTHWHNPRGASQSICRGRKLRSDSRPPSSLHRL